uniref:Uncharacterized protein n=1 Tax=Daphnia galeata TaxID=27404 RepID=A0A8J2RJC9_9CRUS|nr:unnamed protein product [Daphnia galeata]
MEIVSKKKHNLRKSDMTLEDKMNYDAVVCLCSPTVQKLLKDAFKIRTLPASTCKSSTSSYLPTLRKICHQGKEFIAYGMRY